MLLDEEIVRLVGMNKKALVLGTTGHDDALLALIDYASKTIPIVHAPNFSVGVNTLFIHFRFPVVTRNRVKHE